FVLTSMFFQGEDGIRVDLVTGVQTCALPIWSKGDFPGPLFLAVAPIEVEWPQREELGRAISETDLDYDAILRVSGGGRYTGYHRSEERRVRKEWRLRM